MRFQEKVRKTKRRGKKSYSREKSCSMAEVTIWRKQNIQPERRLMEMIMATVLFKHDLNKWFIFTHGFKGQWDPSSS